MTSETAGKRRRPRVLHLSYACGPGRGSEPGIGWHRAVEAAKAFDVWVICEEGEFAAPVRRYLAEHGPIDGLEFVFEPKRPWELRVQRVQLFYNWIYRRWQARAYHRAVELHRRVQFDLVHQVTFAGFRDPGHLWRLGVPFVWGPVGGTQNYPWRFLAEAGPRGAVSETLRSLLNWIQLHYGRRVRQAARAATVLLATNSTNQRDYRRAWGVESQVLLDVGTDTVHPPRPGPSADGPLRLLWSGQFTPRKALGLLLKALARLPSDVTWELRVLGDGPLRRRWQRLAQRLNVANRIQWLGWLPLAEALPNYQWADAFAFTSLRDSSGTVVLEALGFGLPIVCLDHQGMHDIVTGECSLKVPVTTPAQVIDGLRDAIARLARDRDLRARLSAGATARAGEFLWSRNGEQLAGIYRNVLQGSSSVSSNPAFPCP
jgi:glycosyltransferase involved in cell wall biosynthesis